MKEGSQSSSGMKGQGHLQTEREHGWREERLAVLKAQELGLHNTSKSFSF